MERINKIMALGRASNGATSAQVRALVLGVALGCEAVEMLSVRGVGILRAIGSRPAGSAGAIPASSMLAALRIDPFASRPADGTLPAVIQSEESASMPDLARLIAQSEADLIVTDDQDRGFFSQIISGYSLEDLIAASSKPLLIVKRPARLPYHKILVATDFSEAADAAACAALTIAPRAQATFLHAVELPPSRVRASMLGWRSTVAPAKERDAARERLDAQIARLGHRRQLLSRMLDAGTPPEVLARQADRLLPDLIALGRRSPDARGRMRTGKTLGWALEQNEADVLIAHTDSGPDDWFDRPAA